jgi:hypothetical protein
MNLFFIIDEHSDVESGHVVREMADVIMDAIRNPHKPRPEGEWVGGESARCVSAIFQMSFHSLTCLCPPPCATQPVSTVFHFHSTLYLCVY